MQQPAGLFGIQHQLRLAGIGAPKSGAGCCAGGIPRSTGSPASDQSASRRQAGARL